MYSVSGGGKAGMCGVDGTLRLPGQGALGTENGRTTGCHCMYPHPKCGIEHRHPSPVLKGLGHVAGNTDDTSSPIPPSTAQLPVQWQHSQLCREKWRLSVAGAAAARAEGSAWPSRYWMERSWKQGSASSTAVARSVLPGTQTSDNPPCAPNQHPQLLSPVQGNRLQCSQKAAAIVLLLCHPGSEAPGIDAVLQHLLRLQPSGQGLSLGCCRAAEAASAALGDSTPGEMLCRASHLGLRPSCTKGPAHGALRASGSPHKAGGRIPGSPWLQWEQPGR